MRLAGGSTEFSSPRFGNNAAAPRKYEVLQNLISARIEDGSLAGGAVLPSESELARQHGLARSTVRQAMAALERDGLVRRVHGCGTYVHPEAPQRLQRNQSLFALLLPESELEVYSGFQRHFVAAASQQHHQVIACSTASSPESFSATVDRLIELSVSGVAFVPPANPVMLLPALMKLQARRIPVVSCCRTLAGLAAPGLPFPFEEVGRSAGEVLSAHGHRRVLFCAADQPETESLVENGFRMGMGECSQVQTLRLHFSSLRAFHCEASVTQEVDRLFDRQPSPTAIFCTFDSLAELFYVVLLKKGLRVPEDVSLLGSGPSERITPFSQRLTSIVLDEKQLGSMAVGMLRQVCFPGGQAGGEHERQIRVHCFPGRTLRPWTEPPP